MRLRHCIPVVALAAVLACVKVPAFHPTVGDDTVAPDSDPEDTATPD